MPLVKITETVMLFLQRKKKGYSSWARPDDHQLKGFMFNLLS